MKQGIDGSFTNKEGEDLLKQSLSILKDVKLIHDSCIAIKNVYVDDTVDLLIYLEDFSQMPLKLNSVYQRMCCCLALAEGASSTYFTKFYMDLTYMKIKIDSILAVYELSEVDIKVLIHSTGNVLSKLSFALLSQFELYKKDDKYLAVLAIEKSTSFKNIATYVIGIQKEFPVKLELLEMHPDIADRLESMVDTSIYPELVAYIEDGKLNVSVLRDILNNKLDFHTWKSTQMED